jgi:hypothetical protein
MYICIASMRSEEKEEEANKRRPIPLLYIFSHLTMTHISNISPQELFPPQQAQTPPHQTSLDASISSHWMSSLVPLGKKLVQHLVMAVREKRAFAILDFVSTGQ